MDHLSKEAFKKFSDDVVLPLISAAKSAGNSLHFLQTDSWEMGNVAGHKISWQSSKNFGV
jgi:hypothetical protein